MLGIQLILCACVAAGAVFAVLRFRFAKADGTAQLVQEICQEREALSRMMAVLPEQLELARRTRATEAAANWMPELEADLADAAALGAQLPAAGVVDADATGMELDMQLAEILTLSIRANRLANKYRLLPQPESMLSQPGPPRAMGSVGSSLSSIAQP